MNVGSELDTSPMQVGNLGEDRKFCEKVEGTKNVSRLHRVIVKGKDPAEGCILLSTATVRVLVESHLPVQVPAYIAEFEAQSVMDMVVNKERLHWALKSFERFKSDTI